ncbi:type IV secretion protein Rhs [Amycolatopsis antarctica]|uniref:Type IV secretion protein Rhs n=1 Tax=Amycolatopsis antarctica TaxID=1854586 RepID=A0A263D5F5_9PSEU|nr:DUF6531 domain-containing protein [Amycolatopsis antarctica]OZM73732.1 type IV secretion protein Rhs [Amycolatopsis antarctica]
MTGPNPLVAQEQSRTTAVTGIGIAESSVDLANGVADGSWVEAGLGAVGVGLEVLSMVIDPIGTLASYGVSWLIEHVEPLKEALDWFAGDPPVIQSFSETWANVAAEVGAVAQEYGTESRNGTAGWLGAGGDAYRQHAAEQADALAGASSLADGISVGVMVMGEVVAAVRELVRDLVAELVGKLITWALEAAATLGFATPVIAAQATAAISKAISKVSELVQKLVKTISNVSPRIGKIIDKLGEIIEKLAKLGRKIDGGGTTPSGTRGGPDLDAPTVRGPDGTSPSGTSPSSGSPGGTSPSGARDTTPSGSRPPDTPAGPRADPGSPGTSPDGSAPAGAGRNGDGTPGGRGESANRPADPHDTRTPVDQRNTCNDPIDVATGEMVLVQTDVDLAGVLPLLLRRTHVSSYRAGRSFGRSWACTLDQRLEFDDDGVVFVGEDGMLLVYPELPPAGEVLPEVGPRWPLTREESGYALHRPDSGQTFRFDRGRGQVARLASIADHSGNKLVIGRHADGLARFVEHSGGYRIEIDARQGRVHALRLAPPDGDSVTLAGFAYTESGDLSSVTNSSGRSLTFEYDVEGRIVRWVDRNGEWYRYFYDADGRCVANQGSGGFLNGTFAYDGERSMTRFTDALGNTTTYRFDRSRNLVAETDPLGHTTSQVWNEFDQLIERTDPLGRTTRYEYDERGGLVVLTRPDSTQARAEHNEMGRPTVTIDPDGATWRREYDGAGKVTLVVDPSGARTLCTYNEAGQRVSVTDALGRTRRTETDAAGLPILETDHEGNTTRYRRDQFGRIVEITDAAGRSVTLRWTVEGNLLARSRPDGGEQTWRYDGEGNLIEHRDQLGGRTTITRTHFDLPLEEVRPDGTRLRFGYDQALRLTSVTNSQGMVWRYSYDAAGRLISETDFNGRTIGYRYDAAGQLVCRTNGLGQDIDYLRDRLGNVVRREHGDTVETFEFDPMSRMIGAANEHVRLDLIRDPLGRVVAEGVNGRMVTSAYDPIGRRTSRRTPTGAETTWRYGEGPRPAELVTAGHTVSFGYDALGRETERLLDTGTIIAQSWDVDHRLATQTVSAVPRDRTAVARTNLLMERRYRYNTNGVLAGIDSSTGDARSFDLDPGSRITAVRGSGWSESYAYDGAGNITSAAWDGEVEAQGAREFLGSAVTRAGNLRYRYDRQGRIVLRQKKRLSAKPDNWHYTWDADDRLVGVTTPDGARWRYLYDPIGRRVAKLRLATESGQPAERIDFAWDGMVPAEQVHSSGRATCWNWEPGTFRAVTQVERKRGGSAEQEWVDQEFYSIVTDLVGTPTDLVDAEGEPVWRRRATVWGKDLGTSAARADTPLRFPGQIFDPESGLHYNHFRYYDPETGRYTSHDPLGLAPSPNPQAYVPNPLMEIDPAGLAPCRDFYSVQSRADADRLIHNGGEPWPSGVDANGRPRSEFGEGLYAWGDREGAQRYLDRVSSRDGAPGDLEIVQHRISGEDFDRLRSADLGAMDDDTATAIWQAGSRNDYDHITRPTGNFGSEHYFRSGVFHLLQSWRT